MKIYFDAANTGINKTISVIESITNNMKFQEVRSELQFCLISVVHSVGDIYARLKGNGLFTKLPDEDKEFLLAYVYLNNQLKHDINLNVIYYEVSGSMFPMRFPFRFGPPGVYWQDFQDSGKSREAKRAHYDTYLNKKDVLVTINRLSTLIQKIEQNQVPSN